MDFKFGEGLTPFVFVGANNGKLRCGLVEFGCWCQSCVVLILEVIIFLDSVN